VADLNDLAGRDPSRNSSDASYSFDFDEIDRRLDKVTALPTEDLQLEFLIKGVLIVREDIRPQLCIDAVIYGLRHPIYRLFSLQKIAGWNGVTKQCVSVRVDEVRVKLGIGEAALSSLERTRCGPLFSASHGLVTALIFVAKYQEPKKVIDCIVQATGHPISDGVSLDTIGKRYGETKSGIHKLINEVKYYLKLPRSRYNKSPDASEKYAQSNCHTAGISGIPVGPGLSERKPVSA
jgi:hypothetical protein